MLEWQPLVTHCLLANLLGQQLHAHDVRRVPPPFAVVVCNLKTLLHRPAPPELRACVDHATVEVGLLVPPNAHALVGPQQ